MKPDTRIQKKKRHAPSPQAGRPAAPGLPRRSMRGLLLGVLCTLLVGGGTWALFEFVIWNVTPPELVGKWEVVESPPEYADATFEFFKNGKLIARINDHGNLRIMDARIRVEGKKIYSTTTRPTTGEELTTVLVMRTLTERKLVVEDQQGQITKMRRAD
jgi:uncharacterized protein (TIGR03066 family)